MSETPKSVPETAENIDAAEDAIGDAQYAIHQGQIVIAMRCLERAIAALKAHSYE